MGACKMGDLRKARGIKRPYYIALVAALYAAMFMTIFEVAGPPVTGPIETAAVVALFSIGLSWLGTWRVEPFSPSTWHPYLLPSLFHGAVLAIVGLVTVQTILAG